MDLQYLKKLLKIFDDSSAEDLEIEEEGIKLKISKNQSNDNASSNAPIFNLSGTMPTANQPQAVAQPIPNAPAATQTETQETKTNSNLHEIKAPMVGTYYAAPSPDSDDFVTVGQKVKKGQTLCIVEAMKLMNDIESDIDGTVEEILLSNSEAVEYNQVLFHIKPS